MKAMRLRYVFGACAAFGLALGTAAMLQPGAARAADSAGDRQKAADYFGKLVDLASNADTERQEILVARAHARQDDTIGAARK